MDLFANLFAEFEPNRAIMEIPEKENNKWVLL